MSLNDGDLAGDGLSGSPNPQIPDSRTEATSSGFHQTATPNTANTANISTQHHSSTNIAAPEDEESPAPPQTITHRGDESHRAEFTMRIHLKAKQQYVFELFSLSHSLSVAT